MQSAAAFRYVHFVSLRSEQVSNWVEQTEPSSLQDSKKDESCHDHQGMKQMQLSRVQIKSLESDWPEIQIPALE